jgi:SAM-dependent methyltransferase
MEDGTSGAARRRSQTAFALATQSHMADIRFEAYFSAYGGRTGVFLLSASQWSSTLVVTQAEGLPVFPVIDNIFGQLPVAEDPELLHRLRCDSQSLAYYSDISRFMSERIKGFRTFSLLDVGPRTGAGLAFLRLVHHPSAFTRLKLDPVTGIDIEGSFELIARQEFPDIQGRTGDVYDLPENGFDIVLCSHTIEHLLDAEEFICQLERIARFYLILACPYEEREPLSGGHVRIVDTKFLASLGFTDVFVYESNHFHNGLCCVGFKIVGPET